MDATFDAEQRAAATLTAEGPVLLTGAAGTGKSLIAMARASWLLRDWPWKRKKLLFLVHNHSCVDLAEAWFEEMLPETHLDLIEVRTFQIFFNWAWLRDRKITGVAYRERGYLAIAGYDHVTPDKRFLSMDVDPFFEEAFAQTPRIGGLDEEQARQEYADVVLEWDVRTLEDYLACPRPACFGALSDVDKTALWERLFAPANELIHKAHRRRGRASAAALNVLTQVCRSPGKNPDKDFLLRQYGAVIVDDFQNLSPAELRFLAALTGNTLEKPRGNLFLTGDPNQCLYPVMGQLCACGINVEGRTFILRHNYRTSAAIQTFAESLLPELRSDATAVNPGGAPVRVQTFPDVNAMALVIAKTIKAWSRRDDYNLRAYAIIIRDRISQDLRAALDNCNLPHGKWYSSEPDYAEVLQMRTYFWDDSIASRLCESVVIVLDGWLDPCGVHDGTDAESRRARARFALKLLYTAMMRACSRVLIVSSDGTTIEKLKEEAR